MLKPSTRYPEESETYRKATSQRFSEGKTVTQVCTVVKTEESIANRTPRADRNHSQLKLTEKIHTMFNGQTKIDKRKRKHFEGTNKSDVLGPVTVEPWSAVPLRSLNRSYATLRHHLLAESDVEFWRRCRSVTSLVQSGNMIEVAFGYQICIVGTILNSVCHVQVDGP